jgi:glycosyltransferase involved in cell wall biosynthesis
MRIAIVAASLRILGGQAVQASFLIDRWQADPEIDARLIPVNPVPPALVDRLRRMKYMRTLITQIWYWPLLFRELPRADVVHVFSASYWSFILSPLPAILVARLFRKPVLLNYHSGEAPDHLARSWLARWVLRHLVDLTVVPSPFLQRVFDGFGLPARVVPNSIDRERFGYRARDPLRPQLLSTRNFEALYNVACTLRAFARIQARVPEASLTLVGRGSQTESLHALAASLGLRHVTFVGPVPHGDMPEQYAAADIYVQTPAIDNMPLSVLEAFSSGLPVVSTNVGGVPDIVTHGVEGLLADSNDDARIAEGVMTLLNDPDYARQLARAGYESCARYSWETIRLEWLEAYRAALGREARTGDAAAEAAGA